VLVVSCTVIGSGSLADRKVDDTRTFLVFGAFTESMIGASLGDEPRALVRACRMQIGRYGADDLAYVFAIVVGRTL
jgi:hypothetical protein